MSIANLLVDNELNVKTNSIINTTDIIISQYAGGGLTSADIDNDGRIVRNNTALVDIGFGCGFIKVVPDTTTGFGPPTTIVAFAAQPEGTWIKLTGMIASGLEKGCTFVNDTFTLNLPGVWNFSVNISVSRSVTVGDKYVFLTIVKNVTDSNQPLATYSPAFVGSYVRTTNDIYSFSGAAATNAVPGDTYKLFACMTDSSGAIVTNLNIHALNFVTNYFGPV